MIGRVIADRYELLAQVGSGGMGTVWKAQDRVLDRIVAIKTLAEGLASTAEARQRFLREARAASRLEHPGIAATYDFGETEGMLYIVIQIVEGSPVSDLIREGPLPVERAVDVLKGIASALGHAHGEGVLHRDISARNVMIREDGRAVLVDFGLAHFADQTRVSVTETVQGTIHYIAPEIIRGVSGDECSDLFSLGVLGYEMLTGQHPFQGERPEAVLYNVLHEVPIAPSRRVGGIPPNVDAVVLRLLEKEPSERFQSAHDLAVHLAGLSGARPSRTFRWALASALLITATLGGVMVWRILPGSKAALTGEPASVAVLQLENQSDKAEETQYLALGLGEFLASKLGTIKGLRVIPWSTSQRYLESEMEIPEIASELHVGSVLTGNVRVLEEQVQISLSVRDSASGDERWSRAFQGSLSRLLDIQRSILTEVVGELRPSLTRAEKKALDEAPAQNVDAYLAYLRGVKALQGDDKESKDRALNYFTQAIALDSTLAEAYGGIGAVYIAYQYFRWAGTGFEQKAKENFTKALTLDPELQSARAGLMHVYYESYEVVTENVLKLGQQALRYGRGDAAEYLTRGQAYFLTGMADRSIPLFERAIELDPENQAAQWYLVIANKWSGNDRRAMELGEAYLRTYGDDAEIHMWVGQSFMTLGQPDDARHHLEKAAEMLEEHVPLWVPKNLAKLYLQLGMKDKARRTLEQALLAAEESLRQAPQSVRAFWGIVGIQLELGHKEEIRKILSSDLSTHFEELDVVIEAYLRIGNREKALEIYRKFVENGSMWVPDQLENDPEFRPLIEKARQNEQRLRAMY